MINISTLTSILEHHKLTDEQSEELQKVIYGLDDRRIAEAKPPFEKADRICIFYLCDGNACNVCRLGGTPCTHTRDIQHSKNYKSINEVNLEEDFVMHAFSPNDLQFWEKER